MNTPFLRPCTAATLRIGFVMFLLFAHLQTPVCQVTTAPGVVACWGLDGNANDPVGSHNGTAQGVQFVAGLISQSALFNGANTGQFGGPNGCITVPDHPSLDPGTGNFTIEFWVNLNALNAENTFVAKAQGALGWVFLYDNANSMLRLYYQNAPNQDINVSMTLSTGTWYHLAVVRRANRITFYRNGVAVGTRTTQQAFSAPGVPLTLGCYDPTTTTTNRPHGFLNGRLDAVYIYQVALTANQIQAIHQAGANGQQLPPAPPQVFGSTPIIQGPGYTHGGPANAVTWMNNIGTSFQILSTTVLSAGGAAVTVLDSSDHYFSGLYFITVANAGNSPNATSYVLHFDINNNDNQPYSNQVVNPVSALTSTGWIPNSFSSMVATFYRRTTTNPVTGQPQYELVMTVNRRARVDVACFRHIRD